MSEKKANVHWEGGGRNGKGQISTETDALKAYPYGFASRFEDDRRGTNPEELLGAAHAACFSMALAAGLAQAGHSPKSIATTATVHLDKVGSGFAITGITLDTTADVPGVDDAVLNRFAEETKSGCIISKALASVPMTVKVTRA
ncbi:MAG TPA: OsmC family peroxiredoxin [Gemmatimonadaceae bacterium]|nr:OsmC family peroxiredoxin [Gemmatimonadaceae bacterium]